MTILFWLLPAVLVTALVAVVVNLRTGPDPAVTRQEAARKMGEALARGQRRNVGRL